MTGNMDTMNPEFQAIVRGRSIDHSLDCIGLWNLGKAKHWDLKWSFSATTDWEDADLLVFLHPSHSSSHPYNVCHKFVMLGIKN